MASFRLTPLARADLLAIRDYIAQDNPAAAAQYLKLLKEKCQLLAEYPGLGVQREEYLGLYKLPVGNYLIFYRSMTAGIEVIRVLHGSRDIENILRDPTP